MAESKTSTVGASLDLPCFAAKVRLISRVVTNIYDDAFRHLGVKTSQLNILVVTKHLGVGRPAVICEMLHLDTSTLSRNVDRMRKSGWLEIVSEPGRSQPFRLTPSGHELLEQAWPAWEEAQEKARQVLGDELVEALSRPMSDLCPLRHEE